MITPIDIQQVGFGVRFRGYDRREVDNFLDALSQDYETLVRENHELRDKTASLEYQLQELKRKESTLSRTLMTAQKIVDQVKQNAEKDADLILKEAELRAEELMKKAEDDRFRLQLEIQGLYKQKALLLEKLRGVLRTFEKTVEMEAGDEPSAEAQNGHQQEVQLPEGEA